MNKKPGKRGLNRRTFVKLFPAAAVPLAASASGAAPATQQAAPAQPPQKVTKEALHAAGQLIGIELTDAQEAMALPGVNRNLASYERLREVEVPLDTEPAFSFRPVLPGMNVKRGPREFQFSRVQPPAFKDVEELAFRTALELAELVRRRKVSSTELTKMYLARLKRYGPKLNCVITLTEDLALEQAAAADREIRRGKYRGPLHGIPYGAKDLFATRGIRTTWGAEPYRDQVPDHDATAIERLREAGAVLLAKLSMGALAQGGLWFGGMTKNPWNTEQTSSGSSAGSASSTAAGLVGFSIGTETLGSIITPSSICGVTGLRPTYGRVSRYGAMALSWTMDKIGPICRGVEDCAAVLNALYGPDGRDLTVADVPFRWNAARPISEMRIGYIREEFEQLPDDPKRREQAQARNAMYKAALDALRGAGAKLESIEMPKFAANNIRFLLTAEAAAAFDDLTRSRGVDKLSGQTPGDWPNSFRTSRFIPAVEYIRAQRARTLLMREMDKLMASWDVFVSPAPGSASLLITNLTGHPQVAVKAGFEGSLPRAMMFTSGLYDEGAALRVALAFERATKWHTMHPKVDWE